MLVASCAPGAEYDSGAQLSAVSGAAAGAEAGANVTVGEPSANLGTEKYPVFMTPLDIAPRNLTIGGSFALLRETMRNPNLEFVSYRGDNISPDGETEEFIVSAYNPDAGNLLSLESNESAVVFIKVQSPDARPVTRGSSAAARDSPEILAEAAGRYGRCMEGLGMMVRPGETKAAVSCAAPAWSGSFDFFW